MRTMMALFLAAASCGAMDTSPEALRKLVREGIVNLEKTSDHMGSYEYLITTEHKEPDGHGGWKTRSAVLRRVYVDGLGINRVVSRDGSPLAGTDLQEHEESIRKRVADWKTQPPEQRARDAEERRKKREEENAWHREAADALDFRLAGEETIAGRKTLVLEATPHPGYRPSRMWAKVLLKMAGKVWVDPEESEIVRADVGLLGDVTVAWGLFGRLDQGSRFFLERGRVAQRVWVTRKQTSKISARMVLKSISNESSAVFTEFAPRKDQPIRASR